MEEKENIKEEETLEEINPKTSNNKTALVVVIVIVVLVLAGGLIERNRQGRMIISSKPQNTVEVRHNRLNSTPEGDYGD